MQGWTDPTFLAEAHAWIREHVSVTGPIDQTHVRFWSTVLRVPTAEGTLWFKAPEHATEVALTALLARARPGWTPGVVAADEVRGWMLVRDAGTRLREVLDAEPDLRHWESVLTGCGELQLAMAPHVDHLLEMGVPDFRPVGLTDRVAALLDADEFLMLDEPEGLATADREALRSQLPAISAMCEELAASRIPDSIQHDDLNDGNVYVDDDGNHRILDWGDACVSHPFHTLTVALRATAYRLDLAPGGPEILRLRDAYLEAFGGYGTRDELARIADTAYRTGTLARALAWQSYLAPRDPADRGEDLESVPYGLRKFLERGPIGDWR
ncbi:MAG TPA: phosphotransferase [Actinomycetota bacterium]